MPMQPFQQKPISLGAQIEGLPALTAYVEEFAERCGMNAADSAAITLAAEELFANTIHHGDPKASRVEFELGYAEGVATARYRDDAGAFDPTLHPVPDTTLPLEQRPIGGLGIHCIRRTMPDFRYERVDGWNVITFGRTVRAGAE